MVFDPTDTARLDSNLQGRTRHRPQSGRSHRDLTSAPVGGPVEQRGRRPRRALLHASRLFRDSRQLVQADPCCSRRAQAPAKTILPRSNGIMNESSTTAKSARLNGNSNTAKAKAASELTNTPR